MNGQPTFPAIAKARKRIKTLCSQLCYLFMIIRNYAKDTEDCLPGLSGKLVHLQPCNTLTTKMVNPLAELKICTNIIPPTGIKKFWGTSENAVKIQVYSAIIAYCLVAIMQQ